MCLACQIYKHEKHVKVRNIVPKVIRHADLPQSHSVVPTKSRQGISNQAQVDSWYTMLVQVHGLTDSFQTPRAVNVGQP